jgi:hypothetical protein
MTTPSNNDQSKAYETVKSALIALLFLIAGWSYNSIQKLEERLYTIQSTAMTQASAQQLEDRLSRSIEVRFNDLGNRLDLILQLVRASDKNK